MTPLGRDHTLISRQILAERGIEMTPDEFKRACDSAFAKIRTAMTKIGYTLPEDDGEAFLVLRDLLGPEGIARLKGTAQP